MENLKVSEIKSFVPAKDLIYLSVFTSQSALKLCLNFTIFHIYDTAVVPSFCKTFMNLRIVTIT